MTPYGFPPHPLISTRLVPVPPVNRFKQWALDVGLWEAEDLARWRWSAFRPCFWDTHTNSLHRTYRAVISELTTIMANRIKEAYVQGLKDGSLQAVEMIRAEQTSWTPDDRYVN